MTEIRVPTTVATGIRPSIGRWFKRPGDTVASGEPVVEIETEGKTLEVAAPATGVLTKRLLEDGQYVQPGDLLGIVTTY